MENAIIKIRTGCFESVNAVGQVRRFKFFLDAWRHQQQEGFPLSELN